MNKEGLYNYMSQYLSEERKALFEEVIKHRTQHVCVVLEDIFQSHNASAVLRTCDLLGVHQVHTIENRNEYNPNPDVSLGSDQWLSRKSYDNTKECLTELKSSGYAIVATSPHADSFIPEDLPIEKPIALCFGTEKDGLTEEVIKEADYHLKIPMHGFTESYNISVSAALCLYTITQRMRASDIEWELSEEERLDILLDWTRQSVKRPELIEKRFLEDQLS